MPTLACAYQFWGHPGLCTWRAFSFRGTMNYTVSAIMAPIFQSPERLPLAPGKKLIKSKFRCKSAHLHSKLIMNCSENWTIFKSELMRQKPRLHKRQPFWATTVFWYEMVTVPNTPFTPGCVNKGLSAAPPALGGAGRPVPSGSDEGVHCSMYRKQWH